MKPLKRTKSGYKKIFFEDGICIYCGVPYEVEDHALPYSAKDAFHPDGRYLVPACRECNAIAADSVQRLLSQRISFVKFKLEKRYAKLLKMPSWSTKELGEMSQEFREMICCNEEKKRFVQERIQFDYFLWIELGRPKHLLL